MDARPVVSFGDLLGRAVAAHPDRTAFVDDESSVTWAELEQRVARAAAVFAAAGLVPGDRVAIARPSGIAFVVDHLGALRAGLVSCPLNPELTAAERTHVLTDAGVRAVTTAGDPPADVPAAARWIDTGGDTGGDTRGGDLPEVAARYGTGEDVVTLLYTSGTSGRPRGAMLSARALLANARQVAAVDPPLVHPGDVVLLPVPLFHVFGLGAGLGAALWHATTTVLTARFDPRESLAAIRTHDVQVVVGAPPMFAAWARQGDLGAAFAGVRLALSGAAALPAALVRDYVAAGVPLHEGYGLTETAPVLTCNAVGEAPGVRARPVPGSIGRPVPGVGARLLDTAGGPVDPGDPGQLWVTGDNLFSGYWPDGRDAPGPDGFATGDIAVRADDGTLWLVGRTTDLVIVNGFNVYPAEVESVIGALPGVAEVAVVGEPDPRTGETVVAHVVPSPGADLDPDAVVAAARGSLARYKVPTRVEVATSLPHTATGKVQKWRLTGEGPRAGAAGGPEVDAATSGP